MESNITWTLGHPNCTNFSLFPTLGQTHFEMNKDWQAYDESYSGSVLIESVISWIGLLQLSGFGGAGLPKQWQMTVTHGHCGNCVTESVSSCTWSDWRLWPCGPSDGSSLPMPEFNCDRDWVTSWRDGIWVRVMTRRGPGAAAAERGAGPPVPQGPRTRTLLPVAATCNLPTFCLRLTRSVALSSWQNLNLKVSYLGWPTRAEHWHCGKLQVEHAVAPAGPGIGGPGREIATSYNITCDNHQSRSRCLAADY